MVHEAVGEQSADGFARVITTELSAAKTRQLRLCTPQLHPFRTDDGVELLLTRYPGGGKGPVMVSYGLGVPSKIFTIETILAEHLFAAGIDVWLLDFRTSIILPAAVTTWQARIISARWLCSY